MAYELTYQLTYADGHEDRIPVRPDPADHRLRPAADFIPPAWAALTHHQCSHCTLDPAEHPFCPVAVNIAHAFTGLRAGRSYEPVTLTVDTPQRSYRTYTTLQRALSSLLGLISALSDCPHTRPLHPMALHHLPLATEEETFTRALSVLLLREYLAGRDGRDVAATMETLYANLNRLNHSFARRLADAGDSDAAVNAIVLLDVLARDISFELSEHLPRMKALFDTP